MDDGAELTPVALLQRFSDSVDEMSVLLAQFRHRRDFEKKVGSASESSFEQVLDDEALPKAYAIIKIVATTEGSNLAALLKQLRSLFPDDSDLVLVLRELLQRRDLDRVVKERLKTLLQQVEQTANPRRLKAGINVALKARLLGKSLQLSPQLVRESYRDFLESEAHETELYQQWIATYGVEQRAPVVDFMESALLTDMDAQDPSCSRLEFGNLLQRMVQIKLLRSTDATFLTTVLSNKTLAAFHSAEKTWLLFMFSVLLYPENIQDALDELLREHILLSQQRVRGSVLQTLYQASLHLPETLFSDPGKRPALAEEFEGLISLVYHHEQRENAREQGNLRQNIAG
ncbi:type III secretion system gatekeeper subunit SctW [Serratia quinivorans]|uniref:type III secretion system gatekeeper subunit SctW n=1 Tax=Serratia quinivorans TaxID=137545 RepID=UPI003981DABF